MKPVYIAHRTTVRAQGVENPKEIFPNRLVKNNGRLCGQGEQALGSSLNIDVLREGDSIPVSGTGDTVLCVVGNGSYTETDVNNNTGCISTVFCKIFTDRRRGPSNPMYNNFTHYAL